MRGDVYQRSSGGWGSPVGNIAGPTGLAICVPLIGATGAPAPYDSDTLALFRFNEDVAGPGFANEATGAAGALYVPGGSTVYPGNVGPFGYRATPGGPGGAVMLLGDSTNTRLVTANGAFEPSTNLTVSVWVFLHTYRKASGDGHLIAKMYRPSSWTSPYRVAGLFFDSSMMLNAFVNGVAAQYDGHVVPLYEWALVSLTYDGASVSLYVDGCLVNFAHPTGAIAWQTGGNASPWVVGEPPMISGEGLDARVGSLWIEQVCRSASYLLDVYRRGAKRF